MAQLLGTAEGVAYLHRQNPTIIHGDLSDVSVCPQILSYVLTLFNQSNILIDDDGAAVISDLGCSRIQHEVTRTLTMIREGGKARFLAPELATGPEEFRTSTKSDVYSLAMAFFALIMQEMPFADVKVHKVASLATRGSRPIRPVTLPFSPPVNDQVWSLMEHMWAQDPMNRPSAPFVVTDLKEIFTV